MFKNKEIRDNVLLISMAIITIVFLVYIFFPSVDGEPRNGEKTSQPVKTKKPRKSLITLFSGGKVDKEKLADLNLSLEKEIAEIYLTVVSSSDPFTSYGTDAIKKIVDESEDEILKKYSKFSFFDLKEILDIEFPRQYDDTLKFNMYLTVFLIKITAENAAEKLAELPRVDFENSVSTGVYALLGGELEKDYQALPLLFYFKLLLQRLNFYSFNDDAAFFREKTANIRDISYSKHLPGMKEFLSFSLEPGRYRLEWVEGDGLSADDKKTYTSLNLKTGNFFKQNYLVFPDPENKKNNEWIKELCAADSGDIELEELKILSEDPMKSLQNKKILYTPVNPQFIVVLSEYADKGVSEIEFVNRLVSARLKDFYRKFSIVDFSTAAPESKTFKTAIKAFGHYLKKNHKK
ncbi:MAG: hypothetical protein KAW12_22700 [Candidatus Aminicenantes bacterium]|nr:hypothetical protein [Candidatus Aminicenantes bacterium]